MNKLLSDYEKTITRKRYPTADAVIIRDELTIRLEPDGKVKRRHYRLKRVLDHFDRDQKSDVLITYRDAKQKIEVLKSFAYMRSGKKVEAPSYGINQTTPPQVAKAPYFTDIQHKVISLVGVEVGGFTELEYEITDRIAWQKPFEGFERICQDWPVLQRTLIIEVPEDFPFEIVISDESTNRKAKKRVLHKDGYKHLVFTFSNLKQWDDLDGYPLGFVGCPTLYFFEKQSWDDMSKRLSRVVSRASRVNQRMIKVVEEATKDLVDPAARASRLHEHVLEAIATVQLPPGWHELKTRTARVIHECGYGTPFEKAVLLAALLNRAGLPTDVSLVCPAPAFCEEAVVSTQFQQFWVYLPSLKMVMRPDKKRDEARREHLEGCEMLVATSGDLNRLSFGKSGRTLGNQLNARLKVKVKEDFTAEGTLQAMLSGQYNPFFKLRFQEPEKTDEFLKGLVGNFWPGVELDKYTFEHLGSSYAVVQIHFKAKRLTEDPEHRFVVTLPGGLGPLKGFKLPLGMPVSGFACELPGTIKQDIKLTLELAEEVSVSYGPAESRLANTVGEVAFSFARELSEETSEQAENEENSSEDESRSWTYTGSVILKDKYVSAGRYPKLRALLARLGKDTARTLILERRVF